MSNYWWSCKTCGKDCYDSESVMEHRLTTGHVGASLVGSNVPRPSTSSPAARKAALDACRDAVDRSRRARTALNPPDSEETDRA